MKRFVLFLVVLFACQSSHAQIRAVIFDFGGVVMDGEREPLRRLIFAEGRVSYKVVQQSKRDGERTQLMDGRLHDSCYWQQLAKRSQGSLPENFDPLFKIAYAYSLKPIDGVMPLVHQLQEAGYQTPMLSNITPWMVEVNHFLGLYDSFYPLFLSCEMGVAKPEVGIYQQALKELQLNPEECVFIDDLSKNVESAASLGIHAIHFKNAEQLRKDLIDLGIQLPK